MITARHQDQKNFPSIILLEKLLKDLTVVPLDVDEKLVLENVEIISYYQSLIRAKIYRALTSRMEDKKEKDPELRTYDAETSAFIVVNGLISMSEALINLAKHRPLYPLKKRMVSLGKTSLELVKMINLEFNLAEENKN